MNKVKNNSTKADKEVSSQMLRNSLWQSFNDLKKGKIDPATANALASTARGILSIAKLELTVCEMTQTKPTQNLLGFTR